jgi:ABC-type nickel/cobalt efflux system permease component RcnA
LEEAQSGAPVGWKSLVWLGLADGLTPSPSALIVLLAAVSLDRIAWGIALILAFSVGLAIVLALWSLVVVYARRLLEWWVARRQQQSSAGALTQTVNGFGLEGRLLRLLPVGGALALVVMGLFLSIRALSQSGLLGV